MNKLKQAKQLLEVSLGRVSSSQADDLVRIALQLIREYEQQGNLKK